MRSRGVVYIVTEEFCIVTDVTATMDSESIEESADEVSLNYNVRYIHNGYAFTFMQKHGIAATARMLIELPLCPTMSVQTMKSHLSYLKTKREKMVKRSSAEGVRLFKEFTDSEFVFPDRPKAERLLT